MAKGRSFEWHAPDGAILQLQDAANGYWILEGVTGLGKPIYEFDEEAVIDRPGNLFYGSRAGGRQVFLPTQVEGSTRGELLDRKRILNSVLDPRNGPGYLHITDDGKTYRLLCHYADGMSGDEGPGAAGERPGEHWQKFGIVLEAVDPIFESTKDTVLSWGYGGNIPFFPILPIRLNPAQILSDIGQPQKNNFVLNPSAELNAGNWSNTALGSTPSIITRDASLAKVGSWAFRVEASAASSGVFAFPDYSGAPFVVGQTYTFHGWIWIPSGQNFAFWPEIFFGSAGPAITARDDWSWFRLTWSALTTTDRGDLKMANPILGEFFYTDALAISEGTITSPEEYIDGDQISCHWAGTPHASSSFREPLFEPNVIDNVGTAESYPIWNVVGPGSAFTLHNKTTGRRLVLTYALAANQVVTIDTAKTSVRLADGTSLYPSLSEDDFWPLIPGPNTVTAALSGAAVGSQITVRFKPRYEALV